MFVAEASFSAYLLESWKAQIACSGHLEAETGKTEGKSTTKIFFLPSEMRFFPRLKQKCKIMPKRQKTRPWPYLYIVSLVVTLRNWVCDNWVYKFPNWKLCIRSCAWMARFARIDSQICADRLRAPELNLFSANRALGDWKIANRRFQAIRVNRLSAMKIGFFHEQANRALVIVL